MSQSARSTVLLIIIGTILWVATGIVALAANAEAKIIWTCLAGAVLGLVGIRYTLRRARRLGL
ncbi:MAG: DUF2530 domain-containing protein [Actinobacteria bacterium]|nr:DUF2530 domain-containing protein [Actinomycetota bacterium]